MQHARLAAVVLLTAALAAVGLAGEKAEPAAKPAARKPAKNPSKLLAKKVPSMTLAKAPLGDVLDRYAKLSGLRIQADWAALKRVYVTKDTPVTVKASDLTFEKLLDLTLNTISPRNHPLSWYLAGDVVHVSTQMRIILRNRGGAARLAGARTAAAKRRPAAAPREISFSETPLNSVLEFLADVAGVNMHVNWRALEATGISKETPVTVKARGISIARAMDLVLSQLNVGRDRFSSVYWIIDEGVVEISTGETLNRTTKVRIFNVADLLLVVPNFKGPELSLTSMGNNDNTNSSSSSDTGSGLFTDSNTTNTNAKDGEEMSTAEQRKKLREDLVEIIKMTIGEDMWAPTGKGAIRLMGNNLVISQTPLGFKLLEKAMGR